MEGAHLRRRWQQLGVTRGAHRDFLPVDPQDASGVELIYPDTSKEWPAQVQGVYQSL